MGWPSKEARKEYDKAYYLANKEKAKASARKWAMENPERRKEIQAKNQKKSLAQRAYAQKKRQTIQSKAMPKWLTEEDINIMKNLYTEASSSDGSLEVDHIIPLQGKLVCGLHVPTNLQLLPSSDNRKKNNKFEVN